MTLRAISGHRDTGPTECPGNGAYDLLPELSKRVSLTGLPKLYSPVVTGAPGGTVRFQGAALVGDSLDGDRHGTEWRGGRQGSGDRSRRRLVVELHPGREWAVHVVDGRGPIRSAGDGLARGCSAPTCRGACADACAGDPARAGALRADRAACRRQSESGRHRRLRDDRLLARGGRRGHGAGHRARRQRAAPDAALLPACRQATTRSAGIWPRSPTVAIRSSSRRSAPAGARRFRQHRWWSTAPSRASRRPRRSSLRTQTE